METFSSPGIARKEFFMKVGDNLYRTWPILESLNDAERDLEEFVRDNPGACGCKVYREQTGRHGEKTGRFSVEFSLKKGYVVDYSGNVQKESECELISIKPYRGKQWIARSEFPDLCFCRKCRQLVRYDDYEDDRCSFCEAKRGRRG